MGRPFWMPLEAEKSNIATVPCPWLDTEISYGFYHRWTFAKRRAWALTPCQIPQIQGKPRSSEASLVGTLRMASNISENSARAGASTVSVFGLIDSVAFCRINPIQAAKFRKDVERYELEIKAKQAQITRWKILLYKASIDRTLMKNPFFTGKLD